MTPPSTAPKTNAAHQENAKPTVIAKPLSRWGLALQGVRYHWPISLAVAAGIAIATAVITGALVVGDSMRESLRGLTIDRLGRIDQAVIPGGFFQVDDLPNEIDRRELHPVILFQQAVVESGSGDRVRRSGSVQVLGIDPSFWALDPRSADVPPAPNGRPPINADEVILNRAVADDLGVKVGDQVTVRLPAEQAVPADSPLGRRDSQTEGIPRLKVIEIIDNRGLGRFALQPNQVEPMTVFLDREMVAETLDREGIANALLVTAADAANSPTAQADDAWIDKLPLSLSDFGLQLRRVTQAFPQDNTIFDYYSLTSDRLLLPQATVEAVTSTLPQTNVTPILTYLANAIERLDDKGDVLASVPYSTITAIDPKGPLPLDYGPIAGDSPPTSGNPDLTGTANPAPSTSRIPIVLNRWAADALSVKSGDPLRIAYYEPEVENGKEIERYVDAVVTGVVPVTRPSQPFRRTRPALFDAAPTIYNDPDLTPTVPGVTDQDSISDWDLPFQLERKISKEDDVYWNEYRLTPKAFLPLRDGQRLFGSRFGDLTSLRFDAASIPDPQTLQSDLVKALMTKRSDLGWGAIPLRAQQLAASRGTTPFDALFLSLSLFVILAALMLIALLLRLGLMQRAKEYGVLLATGFPGPAASRLAILEGAWTAIPGILLGLIGGLAYAAIVLAGLRSWWVGAVTVPFLEFHATPRSLLLGALAGAAAALLTIGITARRLRRTPARELLAGRFEDYTGDAADGAQSRRWQWDRIIPWTLLALAALTALIGLRVSGPAQAGAFVGSGMLLLFAALLAIYARLATKPNRDSQPRSTTASPSHKSPSHKAYSLTRLAWGNVGRNPLRSTLSVGLMASAAFLIVSISAFQLNPSESGVGGFDLIGQSTTPIYRDLNDPIVRSELLGPDADRLASARIVAMRLQPGQDASCNNLYQASQPQVFGIPTTMGDATRDRPFAWAATAPKGEGAKTAQGSTDKGPNASPWDALNVLASGTADDPVPLILDQNTAMWSLQMRGGVGELRSFSWREGETLHFRVVGLLANSVLQGSLLIGEDNFRKLFPQINGYRNFLIRTDDPATVSQSLENRLSDAGMDITPSRTILARLMAVQNTYLRTFQSLGALGLLLGTIGLAIAQLRGALERQGELAVMRAIGFARRRLATAVMCETGIVLALGIGSGVLCAILAVAPYLLTGQSVPPIIEPLLWVLLIATFGLAAGSLAVAKVIRMPLVDSLRK